MNVRRASAPLARAILWLSACLAWAASAQGADVLPTKPEPPSIVEIAPCADVKSCEGLPIVPFENDTVIPKWLYASPSTSGEALAAAFARGAEGRDVLKTELQKLQALPAEMFVAESYPDFTPALDLRKLSGDRDRVTSVLCAALETRGPLLVRVCLGASGDGVDSASKMWLAGQPVAHGALARLAKGLYPVLIQASSGGGRYRWQWRGRRLAPRLTEVAEEDVKALYAWELAQWQATMDASQCDEEKLLAQVQFDPQTIRGKDGFFRVGRSVNGKWWFISPEGRAWYHCGICALNVGGMGGRRIGKPPVEPATVKNWLGILTGWKFDALGAWTTPEFFDQGVPYAEIIEGYYIGPYVQGTKYGPGIMPDVFDPQWIQNVDEKCQKLCTPLKNSKQLLGYYLDNERGFMETRHYGTTIQAKAPVFVVGDPGEDTNFRPEAEPVLNREQLGLLQFCLSFADRKPPAYAKAWEFVLARHGGDRAAAGLAWGVPLEAERAVMALTSRNQRLISAGYLADEEAFIRLWVEQYYRVLTGAIRKYDPNHLTLGMRHGGTPGPAVLEMEAQCADVISRNSYRAEVYEAMDSVYESTGRPMLDGEYPSSGDTFQFVRNPIEPPGGYGAYQRFCLRRRDALDRLFTHPGMLGYTFYKWGGQPPALASIRWMAEANYRAVPIAVAWDRPPAPPAQPLHGQIFVTLTLGVATAAKLPAPDAKAEPGLRIARGPLNLGLICRQGTWDKRVYGNGITGEVTESSAEGATQRLAVNIRAIPGLFTGLSGKGQYVIILTRNDTKLEGAFDGTYNGLEVKGRALGYVQRPVPTPNL